MGYYTNNGGLIGTTRLGEKKGVYDLVLSQHNNTLFVFSEFTFTSPNEDPFAPTSTEITNQGPYSSSNFASDTSFFQVSEGIQYFTIPQTANYTITAKGASGKNVSGASYEGGGGILRASFSLIQGTILGILVGQRPPTSGATTRLWQGGGGGTFVTTTSSVGSNETATPLIVAGGGAGSRSTNPTYSRANMSPNGYNGNGSDGGTQGDHAEAGGQNATGGGGAAGWDGFPSNHADCRNIYTPSGYPQSSTCSVAYPKARPFNTSSSNPGQGGIFNTGYDTSYRGSGGFGGGGPGGWGGAGGGGGYSGGGNGNNSSTEYAGGGGSFISSSAIDTSASGKNIGTSTGSWSSGSGAFSGHSILSTASGLANLGYNTSQNGSVILERW